MLVGSLIISNCKSIANHRNSCVLINHSNHWVTLVSRGWCWSGNGNINQTLCFIGLVGKRTPGVSPASVLQISTVSSVFLVTFAQADKGELCWSWFMSTKPPRWHALSPNVLCFPLWRALGHPCWSMVYWVMLWLMALVTFISFGWRTSHPNL